MSLITKNGISLTVGKPGRLGVNPDSKVEPELLGINLYPSIPFGTRMMFVDTNGCPENWKIVTDVEDRYLRLTNDSAGIKNDAADQTHTHTNVTTPLPHKYRSWGYRVWSTFTGGENPGIVFPAMKFLLCEKI